ncbi:MAG TPA: sigma 54-interacting transcriptional regulator [Gammaproteobacteria bacterium]|nr:sigma 54-interacting transcriptional regulator [Gammaproteobacteria bacterium]
MERNIAATSDRGDRRVLLVDDDQSLLRVLVIRLGHEGFQVEATDNARSALAALPSFRPHVVVTDVRMEGMDGLALFDAIRAREPTTPVIVLTAHGSIPDAVEATQRGVFAYLTKPFDRQQLVSTIDQASRLFRGPMELTPEGGEWRKEIVSHGSAMEGLLREAWSVSQTDASVLIRGESGTGKELLARAIHRASRRAPKAMIPVNCTAIPETLFEAELFGHEKGSFTGATQSREGLIRAAHEGTLFLDEIGDMPLAFQVKLLRMLQEKEIRAVGSVKPSPVDVRVISATHQDLEAAIAAKTFRHDLYYRLNVVTLEIPPLAARREDIPLLAEHFLKTARAEVQNPAVNVRGFSKEAIEVLMAASWPGNVRQLRNVIDQCVALATTPVVPANMVERSLRSNDKPLLSFAAARDRFEFDYLSHLLEMTSGNVAQAARLADRNRSEFYKLLRRHALEPELFRRGDPSDA